MTFEKIKIVESSNIAHVWVSDCGRVGRIKFRNGGTYIYMLRNAEALDIWRNFAAAESAGKYFHAKIRVKPEDFPYARVE